MYLVHFPVYLAIQPNGTGWAYWPTELLRLAMIFSIAIASGSSSSGRSCGGVTGRRPTMGPPAEPSTKMNSSLPWRPSRL